MVYKLSLCLCLLSVLCTASTIPMEYRSQPSEYRQEYGQAAEFVGEVKHLVDGMTTRTSRALSNSDFEEPVERTARSERQAGRPGGVRSVRQAPVKLSPYRFGYAVKDDEGNDYNQQEQSDGNKITGQYSVLLPDGRIQTVTYSVAPDTGFVADVTYSEAPGGAFGGGNGGTGGRGGNGGGFGGNGGRGGAQASYGAPGK